MHTDLDRITKSRVAQIECKQCGIKTKVYANSKNFNLACTDAHMEWFRLQRNYDTLKNLEQKRKTDKEEQLKQENKVKLEKQAKIKKDKESEFPVLFTDDYMNIDIMSQLILTKRSLLNLTLEELSTLGSIVFKLKKHMRKQLDNATIDDTK